MPLTGEARKAWERRYYTKNRKRIIAAAKQWHAKNRETIRRRTAESRREIQALKNRPCADCGGTFDPVCMDFDHLPGAAPKLANVSNLVGRKRTILLAELAKCELVCANCHRLRTKKRRRDGLA